MTEKEKSRKVVLGIAGSPHGIKGELRIKTYTEDPLAIAGYGSLEGSDGHTYEVRTVRAAKNVVVAKLAGIDSREQAEALNGVEFSITRDMLSGTALDEEEFFHADLIGLMAVDEQGGRYGKICAIHDFGGGDMLELTISGRKNVMIPFSKVAVPTVDLDSGTVTIDPVAAGLAGDSEDGQA